MRALSLWQPWASLVAAGLKTIETRTRRTFVQGPLLICATQRRALAEEQELLDWLARHGVHPPSGSAASLPRGVAVATCRLVGCRLLFDCDLGALQPARLPHHFGAAGRWAWLLEDIRPIQPFPVRGKQGFFNVTLAGEIPPEQCALPGVEP